MHSVTRHALLWPFVALLVAGCGDDESPHRTAPARPETIKLRHGFKVGQELRYDSRTVERTAVEVTIDMRSRWHVVKARPDGAEIEVTIERYSQRVFPPLEKTPPDVAKLNKGLSGARFRLAVSTDGRHVEHLGHEGVPQVSEFSIEGLRTTLASHILKLPEEPVRAGQRWTTKTLPPPDAGPGGVTSRSQWRVLSIQQRGGLRMVELVCLATMEPGPLHVDGVLVKTKTEFHYAYLWNDTEGILESLTSKGSTTTLSEPLPDAGPDAGGKASATQHIDYEASVKLLR